MLTPELILLAGAPGVGKSAVARALQQQLPDTIWLDGDDLWRMAPWRVDAHTIAMVEASIVAVLRQQLQARFEFVIFSWVMHSQEIVDRLLAGLDGLACRPHLLVLTCDEATLARRFADDPDRGEISDLALERLAQTRALCAEQIDTTHLTPLQIAQEIIRRVAEQS